MSSRKRERMEQTSHKVIEKRRRDRINNCLFELSQTVPAAFSKQTSGKLEKAEILEMTVDYLRAVQTTEIGIRFDNGEWFSADIWGDFAHHYQAGYNECVGEVLKYMADVEGIAVSDTRCARLVSFLHNRFRSESAHSTLPSSANGMTAGVGSSGLAGPRSSCVTPSRSGVFHGNGGMMVKTSSRTVTTLDTAVKTVPSSVGHGNVTTASTLLAFSPFFPLAVNGTANSATETRRPPLQPSTTTIPALHPTSAFRPLPSLTVPAIDLRFSPYVRETGSSLLAQNGTGSADLFPGLAFPAAIRKDSCPSA